MSRLQPGARLQPRVLRATDGRDFPLPSGRWTHPQFRRFAGCPICTVHLAELAHRIDEIQARGVQPLVVFHATRSALARHHAGVPFPLVPDPEGELYQAFGVERSWRAMAPPRTWARAVRGLALGGPAVPEDMASSKLLPADFLVDPEGQLVACHYAADAAGGWSVDELLAQLR